MHTGVAAISTTPELAIDKAESDLLADATVNLLKEFDITPDPKLQAAVALVVAAGTVYAPRVVTIKMRKARERAAEKQKYDVSGTGPIIDAAASI